LRNTNSNKGGTTISADLDKEIKAAVEALRQGKIILYPSDTIWGIGCDATNQKAVERIYELKQRPKEKPMILLFDEDSKLNKYIKEVPAVAWDLIEFADKPLTLVLQGAINLAPNVIHIDGSVAVRVTKDIFCRQVIHRFGKPIVSTSANLSNEASPANYSEINKSLKEQVDYVVNWKQSVKNNSAPSSIIQLGMNGDIKIIRK
jgi:L-threonylcarbamoyladenylate synthase